MNDPIPRDWDVPEIFRARMGTQAGRQRAMTADGHVLLVLHELPDPLSPGKRKARLFWRRPDGSYRASHVPAATTVKPLREHVEQYVAAAEALEERVESAKRAEEWFCVLRDAAPIQRSARNLHRALQEAREGAGSDRELIAIRDLAHDLERALELLHAHAREGLDFTIAQSSEEQSRSSAYMSEANHRLNLLAALFFPMTALGSLLGMNLEHGLERWNAPVTFWIVSGLAFVLGFAVRATLPRPPGQAATASEAPSPQPRKPRGARARPGAPRP